VLPDTADDYTLDLTEFFKSNDTRCAPQNFGVGNSSGITTIGNTLDQNDALNFYLSSGETDLTIDP